MAALLNRLEKYLGIVELQICLGSHTFFEDVVIVCLCVFDFSPVG